MVEAKQRVPTFLKLSEEDSIKDQKEDELIALTGVRGCSYCGGLGHRIGISSIWLFFFRILTSLKGACPKLDTLKNSKIAKMNHSRFDIQGEF